MSQPVYKKIGEYRFYSGDEYKEGLNDLKKIKTLMGKGDLTDPRLAVKLYQQLLSYPDMFESLIGEEFIGNLMYCSNGYPERLDVFFASLFLDYKSRIKNTDRVKESIYKGQEVNPNKKEPALKRYETISNEKEPALKRYKTISNEREPALKRYKTISNEKEPVLRKYGTISYEKELALKRHNTISNEKESSLRRYDETYKKKQDSTAALKSQKPVKTKKLSTSAKKEVALFLAGMLTCYIIYTAGNALYYKTSTDRSINKLRVLAASILEPVDSFVSDEHKNMDNKASGDSGLNTQENILDSSTLTGWDSQDGLEGSIHPTILYQYSTLYDINQDIKGWIKIDGTVIDYPVMQTKEDEEYYLYRDFDKETDKTGLPFMDVECDIVNRTSNYLIHAHNMKNGTMFAALLNYKQEEFYKEHNVIHFDTIYEIADYEIVSVFQSRVAYQHEDVFKYYEFIDAKTKEEYDTFIKEIKTLSYYDTGITPEYGEQLITLSTCDRSIDDGRLVVVARKITGGN